MINPKSISYTQEMLLEDNLKRGVKKELLSKQNGPIEVIQSSILKSNDEEAKSKMLIGAGRCGRMKHICFG